MARAAFLLLLLAGIVLLLGGLIPPFGEWGVVRQRVRGAAAVVVVVAAPVAMPFILEDRVVRVVYAVIALGALVWVGATLRNRLTRSPPP